MDAAKKNKAGDGHDVFFFFSPDRSGVGNRRGVHLGRFFVGGICLNRKTAGKYPGFRLDEPVHIQSVQFRDHHADAGNLGRISVEDI